MCNDLKRTSIFDKRYAIITHRLFTGAGQDLYRFLKENNAKCASLIQHSFSSTSDRKTSFTKFENNKEKIEESLDYSFLPDLFVYFKDFLYSFFGILFNKNRFDLIVGCGGFDAFCALLLRWIGKTEKAIFYTIDYVPRRFNNILLNQIYHLIDKICVKYCDKTWNLSPRMAEGREKYNNMAIEKYNKQRIVPIGIWLTDIPRTNKKYEKKTLVFVGHLIEKQGVQLILKAIPEITGKINNFEFIIIGAGDYETELKKLANELSINKHVRFMGPVYDPIRLYNILSKCHLAVALYRKEALTYYADSTKPKTYLAAGLPLLITDVPHNAKEIENKKCGKIVKYDLESVVDNIINLMEEERTLEEYSENARNYAEQFDWNKIFWDALIDV